MDGTRLQQLQRLENIFKPGEMGLGHATSELMGAMVDLSGRPGDLTTRQVVLARAGDLAARFSEAGTALDGLQAGVIGELRVAVAEVNGLASSIADVNRRIAGLRGMGQPANDLLDERDRLLSRLSTHVQVSRIEANDGTMAVFISGGQRLVLGTDAAELQVLQDPSDPGRAAVGLVEGGVERRLNENALGGGSIAGLLRFQNDDLVSGQALVGQLAAALGGAINAQHVRGLNLQVPYGSVPSSPLFAMGPAQALPHAANAVNGSGNPMGEVTLTITNPAALQASEYDLRETAVGSGNWVLTRLLDGQTTAVSSGDVVDGMQIDFTTAPPQPGDRFLLQPVTRAANGMVRLLDDPRDVAAASPLVATSSPANVGTAVAASLLVTTAPLPVPGGTARVTFTNDTGDYAWELLDSAGALLGSGTATWSANQTIPTPPVDINGFSLMLSGVPRTGDVITVESTPATALTGNNGNARAMLELRDAALVGGRTATDAWSLAMADIGVRVQRGETTAEISDAVAGQNERARSAESGVNLVDGEFRNNARGCYAGVDDAMAHPLANRI
jgi:flagellar hook-associated protein 1 FlgK